MRFQRATSALLLAGALVACGNSASPEGLNTAPSLALLRYDDSVGVIEVLDGDLAVKATMHVENPTLMLPRSIDGAFLLDVAEEGATVYDLRTAETRTIEIPTGNTNSSIDVPAGLARFSVRTDTPVASSWRLVDKFDLFQDLLAINADTGEAVSMEQEYSVDGVGRVEAVGGVIFGILNGPIAQSIVVEINGEAFSHRLVDGLVIDHRDGVDLAVDQGPGMPTDVDIVLSRNRSAIGSPLNVKTDSLFRAAIIDDTSTMILTGGKVFAHDFVTGRAQPMFAWGKDSSFEFLAPDRVLVTNGSESSQLLDAHGSVVAELPPGAQSFYIGTECALLTIDHRTGALIRLDTGAVISEFSVDPEFVDGTGGCTTWGYGSEPVLVVDGAVVETDGAVVDDVSDDSRYAVVWDGDGPWLLEIATGERTSLPAGEYRFVELGDQAG